MTAKWRKIRITKLFVPPKDGCYTAVDGDRRISEASTVYQPMVGSLILMISYIPNKFWLFQSIGKTEEIFSKWWFLMVIYHGIESVKNHQLNKKRYSDPCQSLHVWKPEPQCDVMCAGEFPVSLPYLSWVKGKHVEAGLGKSQPSETCH